MTTPANPLQPLDEEQKRACQLGMWGLLDCWSQIGPELRGQVLAAQSAKRHERSLDRRIRASHLGIFKPVCDFDWAWPRSIDRLAIDDLMRASFLAEAINPILVGPTGSGKTMLAQNIAHAALLRGRTVRVTDAATMLTDLGRHTDSDHRRRALNRYVAPALLVIDCLGNNVYDTAQTDLLFAVVAARHLKRSTLVTTALSFGQWPAVFPNATCVHKLIDLLAHRAEVITIDADSYRFREAKSRAEQAETRRRAEAALARR